MNLRKAAVVCMTALLLPAGEGLMALTAREIIDRAENAVRGNSAMGTYAITIKTRRWTRTMELKSWDHRSTKRSFSEITAPKKDAGNRFLLVNKTMHQYVPKLQQEIKISPSMMMQSWMGSDFTNDDIVKESSILDDYTQRLIGNKSIDGTECYEVELIPKKDADVVWGKIIYYARITDCLPVRQEFYNEHNVMKKVMALSGFKTMHDRVIPTIMKMQTVGKDDRYTVMEIKEIRFNVAIPDYIFSLQNLKRK